MTPDGSAPARVAGSTGVGVGRDDTDPARRSPPTRSTARIERSDGRVDPTGGALADALGSAAERLADRESPSIDATERPHRRGAGRRSSPPPGSRRCAGSESPDADEVVWVEGGALHLAPIDVSQALADRLFATLPAVLVSATLGGGARFAPFARRLGLDPDAEPGPVTVDRARRRDDASCPGSGTWTWRSSPRSTSVSRRMLYVPRHLPEPRDPAWADAARPRPPGSSTRPAVAALVLCTSRAAVERMAARLRDETDHPVLVQGESVEGGAAPAVRADEASCLVATRSFWIGVDVPGPSCVLVVIDRLPFARPDDPLAQARREKAERAGGSGFRDVDLPAAALVLAQGAGRLIRSR